MIKTRSQRPVAARIPKDSRLYPGHVRRPTGSTVRVRCEWMATETAILCHEGSHTLHRVVFPIQQYSHNRSSQASRIRAFQEEFACNRLTKRLVCGRRAQVGRGSLSWDRPRDQATLSSDLSSVYRPDSFPCSCARVACATNLTGTGRSHPDTKNITPWSEQVNRSEGSALK